MYRELTSAEYEHAADTSMDMLHENLEILVEQYGPDEWEVEYSVCSFLSLKPTLKLTSS